MKLTVENAVKIAEKYKTSVSKIKENNNLTTNTIYPGAILKIK